jgi:CO dehydrogenase maturation factor
MAFTISIAGKGGTGKTTIAALLVKIITDNKLGSCLAIDADPNSNLGELLGINHSVCVGQLLDGIAKKPASIPSGIAKKEFIESEIAQALAEEEGFDLLSMGRPEGPGCYCYVNNLLRDIVKKLNKQYQFCVIDNEAGMEHLSRRTSRQADFFIVVSDATAIGMHAAARIRNLIDELEFKFKKVFLFINKANSKVSLSDELSRLAFEKVYQLPFDEKVSSLSLKGEPLTKLNKENSLLQSLEDFRREYEFRAA